MQRSWLSIYMRDAIIGHIDRIVAWYLNKQAEEIRRPVIDYYTTKAFITIHPATIASFLWCTFNTLALVLTLKAPPVVKILITTCVNVCAAVFSALRLRTLTVTFDQIMRINEQTARLAFPHEDR